MSGLPDLPPDIVAMLDRWQAEARARQEEYVKNVPEAQRNCDHGVTFDAEAAKGLDEYEVRRRWPRGWGPCPKGCGFSGIAYASYEHYIMGDW
jgi:hypothetical protein